MPRLSLAAPLLVACAAAPAPAPVTALLDLTPATSVTTPTSVSVAEVRADEPTPWLDPCPSARCGVAGEAAQVTLDERRAEALALFERYVRAVSARATDDLRALLDDTIGSARDGGALSREHVVALHARLFELMSARGFEASSVNVLTLAESRRRNRGAAMEPGDVLVEWRTLSFRASTPPNAMVAPTQMIVRWRGGVPRAAAFNPEFLTRR